MGSGDREHCERGGQCGAGTKRHAAPRPARSFGDALLRAAKELYVRRVMVAYASGLMRSPDTCGEWLWSSFWPCDGR